MYKVVPKWKKKLPENATEIEKIKNSKKGQTCYEKCPPIETLKRHITSYNASKDILRVITPVAALIFEAKIERFFLESFFRERNFCPEQLSRAKNVARF